MSKPTDSVSVEDLLLRWEELRGEGADPNLDELCINAPHLVEQLRQQVRALRRMDMLLDTNRDAAETHVRGQADTASDPADTSRRANYVRDCEWLDAVQRYELKGPLGEGGRAVVHNARDSSLQRDVAIKLLRPKLRNNHQAQSRLQREARIVSQLDHPGIVPVYGSGACADGTPFYAMQQVAGGTLRQAIREFHATTHSTAAAERKAMLPLLRHFVDACQTVAYVHQRGFVHRDLKPENVLVGEFGATFVVDWGLAKRINDAGEDDRIEGQLGPNPSDSPYSHEDVRVTQTGAALGTPAYMSPEQASGTAHESPVRSDIFNLGATLFTMLTGRAPYGGTTMMDVFRRARDRRFSDDNRGGNMAALFRGEPALQAICLKAMARRPMDRYDTASALAADVERVLADQPVECFREPLTQRLWRWGQHHRPLLTSLLLLSLVASVALIVGSALVHRQSQRADANFRQAHQAVTDSFVRISDDFLLQQPEFQVLRSDLLAGSLEFYEHLLASNADPRIQAEMAMAYLQVGKLRREMGQLEAATKLLSRAAEMYQRLAADATSGSVGASSAVPLIIHQATCLREVALAQSDLNQLQEAQELLRQTLESEASLDVSEILRSELAEALLATARLGRRLGDMRAARTALSDLASLVDNGPNSESKLPDRIRARWLLQRSGVAREDGDPEQALATIVAAINEFQSSQQQKSTTKGQLDLVAAHETAAELLATAEQTKSAAKHLGQAAELLKKLTRRHPHVRSFGQHYRAIGERYSDLLAKLERRSEAVDWLIESIESYRTPTQNEHAVHQKLARRYLELGDWHRDEDRINEAHDSYVAAFGALRLTPNSKASSATAADLTFRLARSLQSIGVDRWRTGRNRKALDAFERSTALLNGLSQSYPDNSNYAERLAAGILGEAMAWEMLEQYKKQIERCQVAMEIQQSLLDAQPEYQDAQIGLSFSLFVLSGGYLLDERQVEADEALRHSRERMPGDAGALYQIARNYAQQASRFGREKTRYSDRDAQQLRRYIAESLHCLQRAVQLGLEEPHHLGHDPALLPLRGEATFRELIGEREQK